MQLNSQIAGAVHHIDSPHTNSPTAPTTSVLIPSRGQPCVLRAVRSCLQDRAHPALEIIVVLNPPQALRKKQLEALAHNAHFDALTVLETSQLGASAARNLAARRARGHHLYFLDDDVEITAPNFFKVLAEHQKTAEVFGGAYGSSPHTHWIARSYNFIQMLWLARHKLPQGHQYLLGGNWGLKKSLFESTGGFDPALPYGGSETTLQTHLHPLTNALIYDPKLVVDHDFQGGLCELLRRAFLQSAQRRQLKPSVRPLSLATIRQTLARHVNKSGEAPLFLLVLGLFTLSGYCGRWSTFFNSPHRSVKILKKIK